MTLFAASLSAAEAHLSAGRNVLIRGDAGAGKSSVLRELVRRAEAAETAVVPLRAVPAAVDSPLGLLHTSADFLDAADGRPTVTVASAWLRSRLNGVRPIIAVDDAVYADRVSLALLVAAARDADALLVCVHPTEERDGLALTRATGERFAEVVVEPLGIRGINTLFTQHGTGAVEATFVADLTTWSAGNCRVALALFDAGVRAGVVQRLDGVWVNSAGWDDFPFGDAAPELLAALTAEECDAIRLLAWMGAIPLPSAERVVGADRIRSLSAAGRLVTDARDPASTVVVSPPALTRALLSAMTPLEQAAHSRAVERTLGDSERPMAALTETAWWRDEEAGSDLPDSITFLTQRMQPRVTALWREWIDTPEVSRALRLLRVLMVYMADTPRLARVFAETQVHDDSDPEDVSAFLVLSYQWQLANGRIAESASPHLPSGWDVGAWAPSITYAINDLLLPLRHGRPVTAVVDQLTAEPPTGLHDTVQLLRAEAALERGMPGEADAAAAAAHRYARGPSDLWDRLDAVRGDALLASGAIAEAGNWFREHLAAGYDLGDAFTVKIHARGLATTLLLGGDAAGAWRAVSAALRIGRPGPLSAALDERLFGIAAALSARRGDLTLAQRFADELERVPSLVRPRLDVMRAWARAEIAYATRPEDPDASERLWAAGTEQLDRGALLPGLICWTLIGSPLTEDRLAELRRVRERVHTPLLDPAIRVHRAITGGDPERILRTLRGFTAGGPLERCAFRIASDAWETARGTELDGDSIERLADARVAVRWQHLVAPSKHDPGALTDRERQVLELAKNGRSNRDIADALFVSVRTVENHLYRARQKTGRTSGMSSRGGAD